MTIRGGGDTRWAMAAMPSEECARRPGALPPKRMVLHGPDPQRVQPNTRLRRDATRPRRAPLRFVSAEYVTLRPSARRPRHTNPLRNGGESHAKRLQT